MPIPSPLSLYFGLQSNYWCVLGASVPVSQVRKLRIREDECRTQGGSGSGMRDELEFRGEFVPCISSPPSTWKSCALLLREPQFGFCWAEVKESWAARLLQVPVLFEVQECTL